MGSPFPLKIGVRVLTAKLSGKSPWIKIALSMAVMTGARINLGSA
jgi:hypothetical protein